MQYKKGNKILFIVNDISFFLSHRIVLAKEMLKKDYKVIVAGRFSHEINFELFKNIEFINLPIFSQNINPLHNVIILIKIFFIIKKHKPDILHLITIKPIIYGSIASRLLKIKKIIFSFAGFGRFFHIKLILKILF